MTLLGPVIEDRVEYLEEDDAFSEITDDGTRNPLHYVVCCKVARGVLAIDSESEREVKFFGDWEYVVVPKREFT